METAQRNTGISGRLEIGDPNRQGKRMMLKRMLVVDDERSIADTLAAILRNAGYEVTAAYDGLSALSRCESFHPDLVITDVVMPGMTGIEMAILIKQRYPACKVLLFSGQATTADLLEKARQSGYDFELLAKPIHPTDLLAKLAPSVDKGSQENSPTDAIGPVADTHQHARWEDRHQN